MQGNKTNRDNREINLIAHGFRSTKDKSFADPWRDRDAENAPFSFLLWRSGVSSISRKST